MWRLQQQGLIGNRDLYNYYLPQTALSERTLLWDDKTPGQDLFQPHNTFYSSTSQSFLFKRYFYFCTIS